MTVMLGEPIADGCGELVLEVHVDDEGGVDADGDEDDDNTNDVSVELLPRGGKIELADERRCSMLPARDNERPEATPATPIAAPIAATPFELKADPAAVFGRIDVGDSGCIADEDVAKRLPLSEPPLPPNADMRGLIEGENEEVRRALAEL
jgi:hypothetical protein